MLRKWDFPDPKWPFRKAPLPSFPEREVRTISRLFITSAVTTNEERIICLRSGLLKVLQLNDRFDFRNLDEVANLDQSVSPFMDQNIVFLKFS